MPRDLSRQALAEVVEPRYEELFALVQADLRKSGYEELVASGIVLTGGASKIEGAIELAEEIFHMPVSIGMPKHLAGLKDIVRNPVYATGVGLLHYGFELEKENNFFQSSNKNGWANKISDWFKNNF